MCGSDRPDPLTSDGYRYLGRTVRNRAKRGDNDRGHGATPAHLLNVRLTREPTRHAWHDERRRCKGNQQVTPNKATQYANLKISVA